MRLQAEIPTIHSELISLRVVRHERDGHGAACQQFCLTAFIELLHRHARDQPIVHFLWRQQPQGNSGINHGGGLKQAEGLCLVRLIV